MEEDACAASPSSRRSAAVAVTAAASTGSSAAESEGATRNPFAHYGNITLNVWSADNQDPGPEPVIKALAASFSKKYPNVTIKTEVLRLQQLHQDHQALAQQRQRAGRGRGQPGLPDRFRAGQGEADPAARQATPRSTAGTSSTRPARRSSSAGPPDGKTFGKGNLWGVAQFGQSVGVFYNKALLKKYGGDPNNMPKTFAGFDKLLAKLRANAPADVPIIYIGNKDGYPALHAFGMVQGAYVDAPVRPQLDLPRPGQHVRVARQHQGADAVPAVVQGQLLRPGLQRRDRERRRCRIRQGQRRVLPRRQLAGAGHQGGPRGRTPGS